MRLIPPTTFKVLDAPDGADGVAPFSMSEVTTEDLFAGKRVVVFAVPAAFQGPSSDRQLSEYEDVYGDFQALGIDGVYCLSVNDPFAMYEWGRSRSVENVRLLADGNGEFTRKMGMLVEKTNLACGLRSWRYSMFVDDQVVQRIFVEDGFADNSPDDPFEVTDADTMIGYLQNWREPLP